MEFAASLSGTELPRTPAATSPSRRPPAAGTSALHATGLPRREDGEYYQAWLKNDAGLLVPIGSFNDGRDVTLWAGVAPSSFSTLTVTQEVADGDQASSGQVVLIGQSRGSPDQAQRAPEADQDPNFDGAPGRIRTYAPASGGRCSIP